MGGKREFCVCVCLSACVCTVLYFVSHERQRTLQVRDTAILCDPMDYSPRGSSVHGDSPGKNTRVGCHFLLQGTFPIQGLNFHLLHWQANSLPLSHSESHYVMITEPSPWFYQLLNNNVRSDPKGEMTWAHIAEGSGS